MSLAWNVRPFTSGQVRWTRKRASTLVAASTKHILIDTPVSNNGARVRFVIYKKGLQDEFDVKSPMHYGGLKTPEYLKLNPQGKFPLLVSPEGHPLPESEVIVQYLLDRWAHVGPSLKATTPEARSIGALVTRIHDLYIVPIQGCMYRKMESAEQRAKEIAQIAYELDAIEHSLTTEGPYICGRDITTADGALAPTMVFITRMLPKYFGWKDVFAGRPKLAAWWEAVNMDPELSKVLSEVHGGLDKWEAADRWNDQGINQQLAANPQLKWAF